MRTLVDFNVWFPKGAETAVFMSQASPGPFPCPSGDIISPFGMFPAPLPGTRRAFRLKAVYFDENANGSSFVQISVNLFSGAKVLFNLPRVCSAGGASNFHFSDWHMPDTVDVTYAHVFATFVGSAVFNNSAGVYSLIMEAHDLPMFEGLRIRNDIDGAIYVMLDGVLRHIPNPDVYHQLFRAEDYRHAWGIEPYPVKAALAGEMILARTPGNPSLYLLIDGVKRHIVSMPVVDRFGFDMNRLVDRTAEELAAIPDGPPIQ